MTTPNEPAFDDPGDVRGSLPQEDQFRLLVEAAEDYAIISPSASGRVAGWNDGRAD